MHHLTRARKRVCLCTFVCGEKMAHNRRFHHLKLRTGGPKHSMGCFLMQFSLHQMCIRNS